MEVLNMIRSRESSKFIIFSDCMSLLKSLASIDKHNKQSHIIVRIKYNLLILNSLGKEVNFYLVPAYCGIVGNEIADKAAVSTARFRIDTQ